MVKSINLLIHFLALASKSEAHPNLQAIHHLSLWFNYYSHNCNESGINFLKRRHRFYLIFFKCLTNISTQFIEELFLHGPEILNSSLLSSTWVSPHLLLILIDHVCLMHIQLFNQYGLIACFFLTRLTFSVLFLSLEITASCVKNKFTMCIRKNNT